MQRSISSSSPIEGFDSSNKLRLGSSSAAATATAHHHRDFRGRVIFSDPCAACGTKKRRVFNIEESDSEPQRKKISVDPISIKHLLCAHQPQSPSIPTPLPSFPATMILSSQTPSPPPPESSPVETLRRWNSCPVNYPVIDAFASPESQTNNNANAPHNLGGSDSPATAPLPPRPASMLRSYSDITPAPAGRARRAPAPATSGRLISPTFLSSRESPIQKRWKRMKESLEEMKNWVDSVAEDERNDDCAPQELCNDVDNENVREGEGEENVEPEPEVFSDTVTFMHKCHCGKQFQFFLSAKSV